MTGGGSGTDGTGGGGPGGGTGGSGGGRSWDDVFSNLLSGGGEGNGEGRGRQPADRVDLTRLMSGAARDLVVDAARYASSTGAHDLDTDHLLWAALNREHLRTLLHDAGLDADGLSRRLERPEVPTEQRQTAVSLTPATKRALLEAHRISRNAESSYIGPEHVLMALAANPESPAGQLLAGRLSPRSVGSPAPAGVAEPGVDTGTPTLDQFGTDLTAAAREGRLDPVVGRENEIAQTIEVLSRRTKNDPVLIGEAGVGKTSIVEGIAQRIVADDVPKTIAGKRVFQIDLVGVIAGTRFRGDFEERLKKIIDEVREHRDKLIIFIDEVHTVVGVGASGDGGGLDASNILKPALARGVLRIIGATTLDEYRRRIERDTALARRFQPILVSEPTPEQAFLILCGLRDQYEAHHQVRFTDEALRAAVDLSDRYISDRFLPDKAIDLIDQAGARVRLRNKTPKANVKDLEWRLEELNRDKDQAVADELYERASALRDEIHQLRLRIEEASAAEPAVPEVGPPEVAEVVSRATGIPVAQLTEEERDRLLRLEDVLHRRVIGQDEAVRAVAEAVRRSRAGLGDPNRPIGSFLFLGPTGVGKTELARGLAEALFGDQDRIVRLDMSEFQERHTVARLVGAPPGYVGYDDAGQLTEVVRRRPYAVVLLDEIEKAHRDVFNILLQILDEGRLTDSQGRTVSFRNTLLVMTSNLGSDVIVGGGQRIGFETEAEASEAANQYVREQILGRLPQYFPPEFVNRIDEVIIFHRLELPQIRQITELTLEQSRRRLRAQNVLLEFTPEAVDWLARRGYQPEFGARPMRRTIQREVDNVLSRKVLDSKLRPGQTVVVDADEDRLSFDILEPQAENAPARG